VPVTVDHDARRAELAQAVWRIVVRDGVRAASVRGVAQEAGLSMGSVRHFFASQHQLLVFAVQEIVRQASERIAAGTEERLRMVADGRPLAAVVSLLEEVLPLDDERLIEARVWAAFTSAPISDPEMAAVRKQADDGVHQLCGEALAALTEFGLLHPERDRDLETSRIHALLDGLTLHLMLGAAELDDGLVRLLLLTHLRDLQGPPATTA
jgi:AcrR family transcriptional regulator